MLKLALKLDASNIETLKLGAKTLVELIKPDWKSDELNFQSYTDGITNQLIGVWCNDKRDQVLIRIYGNGTELFIDRQKEVDAMLRLHTVGCGPQLFATFQNGLSYAFTPGAPLHVDNVAVTPIWQAVCKQMAVLHKMQLPEKAEPPMLFTKLVQILNLIPLDIVLKQPELSKYGISLDFIKNETKWLRPTIENLHCPVVFCHNDLLLGNIIWHPQFMSLSFIDFEYAAPNYQAFDVANHFCEFAGVEEMEFSRYPKESFQLKWLRCYLSHFQGIPESEVKEQELQKWLMWVKWFSLASNFLWGAWALVQTCISTLDFDFMRFAVGRIEQYKAMKHALEFSID